MPVCCVQSNERLSVEERQLQFQRGGVRLRVSNLSLAEITLSCGDVVQDKYRVVDKLGQGGFGAVYKVEDVKSKEEYALKLESKKEVDSMVKVEGIVLKALAERNMLRHACKFIEEGETPIFRFLVMQLLGRSLSDLRKTAKGKRLSINTTVRLGIQAIEAIEGLHRVGFLHRDVKPGNFAMGRKDNDKRIVFMLDYGLCRQYIGPGGHIRPAREEAGFRGTVRYASINAHLRKELGRHDDLWSLYYMLIEMRAGELPWRKDADKDAVLKKKRETPIADLLHCINEPEFTKMHEELQKLTYFNVPNYLWFCLQLRAIAARNRCKDEDPYDWEPEASPDRHTEKPPSSEGSSRKSLKEAKTGKSARDSRPAAEQKKHEAPPEPKTPVDAKCLDPFDTTTEGDAKQQATFADPLSRALFKLAADLYGKIGSDGTIFSPLSIAVALTSAEMASSGETRHQLQQLLSQGGLDAVACDNLYASLEKKVLHVLKSESQLRLVNGIFLDANLRVNEAYVKQVMERFRSDVVETPITKPKKARQQINQWLWSSTQGKMADVYKVGGVDRSWACVLVNAIYMKIQFNVKRMKKSTFIGKKGIQKVDFMCGENAPYMGREDFHAIELLYKGDVMSMYVILPRRCGGMKELEKKVNANFLIDVFTHTRHIDGVQLRMEIPVFGNKRFTTSMLPAFAELGLRSPGGFGRMSDDPRTKISDIKHDVFIEVSF